MCLEALREISIAWVDANKDNVEYHFTFAYVNHADM